VPSPCLVTTFHWLLTSTLGGSTVAVQVFSRNSAVARASMSGLTWRAQAKAGRRGDRAVVNTSSGAGWPWPQSAASA
jgi:hypothetical protein